MPSVSTLTPARPTAIAAVGTRVTPRTSSLAVAVADAQRWCALAVGSLVIAGLLSLAVVVGRLPILSRIIDDPLFFKRCLVVHVDLALVVWFYAFLAGLISLTIGRAGSRIRIAAFALSVSGVLAML